MDLCHTSAYVVAYDFFVGFHVENSAEESVLEGVVDVEASFGVGVAHGFVEHEYERVLVEPPAGAGAKVEKFDGTRVVESVLEGFDAVVYECTEDWASVGFLHQLWV